MTLKTKGANYGCNETNWGAGVLRGADGCWLWHGSRVAASRMSSRSRCATRPNLAGDLQEAMPVGDQYRQPCEECGAVYEVPRARLGPRGIRIRCTTRGVAVRIDPRRPESAPPSEEDLAQRRVSVEAEIRGWGNSLGLACGDRASARQSVGIGHRSLPSRHSALSASDVPRMVCGVVDTHFRLLADRFDDGRVLMAQVRAHQLRAHVEVTLAARVPKRTVLCAGDV